MNRAAAQFFLGDLVERQIREDGIEIDDLALEAKVHPNVIKNVKVGKADLHRQEELRKLIRVLFLAGNRRRTRAYRLLYIISPTQRNFRSLPYNNRKRICRGRWVNGQGR